MSYSLHAQFFRRKRPDDNWQKVIYNTVDFLKILNDRSYSVSFEDIESIVVDKSFPKNVGEFFFTDYVCDVKNDEETIKYLENNGFKKEITDDHKGYVGNKLPKDLESHKIEISINDYINKKVSKEDYISVFINKSEIPKGFWYNIDSFINAKGRFSLEYEKLLYRKFKLDNLKDSIDFFKLDEESLEKYNQEVSYVEDILEDYKYKKEACEQMITLLDFLRDSRYLDEETESDLYNSEIIVYIYS